MPDPKTYDGLLSEFHDLQDDFSILEGDLQKANEANRPFKEQAREASQKCAQLRGLAVMLGSFVPKEDLETLRKRISEKDPDLYSSLFGEWPQEKNI